VEVTTAFRFRVDRRHGTDGPTDGVQHFICPIQVYFGG